MTTFNQFQIEAGKLLGLKAVSSANDLRQIDALRSQVGLKSIDSANDLARIRTFLANQGRTGSTSSAPSGAPPSGATTRPPATGSTRAPISNTADGQGWAGFDKLDYDAARSAGWSDDDIRGWLSQRGYSSDQPAGSATRIGPDASMVLYGAGGSSAWGKPPATTTPKPPAPTSGGGTTAGGSTSGGTAGGSNGGTKPSGGFGTGSGSTGSSGNAGNNGQTPSMFQDFLKAYATPGSSPSNAYQVSPGGDRWRTMVASQNGGTNATSGLASIPAIENDGTEWRQYWDEAERSPSYVVQRKTSASGMPLAGTAFSS